MFSFFASISVFKSWTVSVTCLIDFSWFFKGFVDLFPIFVCFFLHSFKNFFSLGLNHLHKNIFRSFSSSSLLGCSGFAVSEPLVFSGAVLLFMLLNIFLPYYLPISSSNWNRLCLCFRGISFLPVCKVGGCGSLEFSFRCKQGRAFSNHFFSCLQAHS